jgi:hypothetical protein
MSTEFKIGDLVWVPVCNNRPKTVPCTVCAGKNVVRLELGTGEMVTLPCENCGKGCEGPQGVEQEYHATPDAEPCRIDGIERHERENFTEVAYRCDCYVITEAYATKEEAIEAAKAKAAKENAIQKQRADWVKHDKNKNYAWNAGYHMRCAKEAARKLEYHTSMAQLCKEKTKETT